MKRLCITALLLVSFLFSFTACGDKTENKTTEAPTTETSTTETTENATNETSKRAPETSKKATSTITVTTSSAAAGNRLLTACAASSVGGSNQVPGIAWNSIEGATNYAVYMIDTSAGNWLHWKAYGITDNSIAQGASVSNSQYKGPYPPSGTHSYQIIVYALAEKADSYPGNFDAKNSSISTMEKSLDTASGKSGNILAKGSITLTYAHGDNNV